MSYNLVDPTTGDLTRVAGGNNINDETTSTSTTWSSEKISADLADKQDFRIFNSLEEFNEKKGTSLTVVSGIDNMADIANAMSEGDMLIIKVSYITGSEIYFGLDKSTGWTKMFTFIKSNGICDVECRTTFPLTLKRVLNSDGVIGDWQVLATTDSTLKTIQLSGSVDCNTLTEPGLYTASAGAVISITNTPANIGSAVQLDGGFSVLVTKTNVDGVYYGMQMFIPYGSDVPFIRKSYYFNGQHWTDWQRLVTNDDIFLVGDRRNTIGWADLSNDVNIDGSSNYANNVGRIEGHNALIEVTNPSTSYQWPVTNSGDNNAFIDFGGAIQYFVDKVNNHLYVRFADSVDMSAWGEIATMDKLGGCSIIKGTTTSRTNSSGAMNLAHGGNFDHCTVSIQPTTNKPYFFSYCPLSKDSTYIIVTDWKGEIVTNTEIEFDWVVIGW